MSKKSDIWMLYSTFPNKKSALAVAKKLVEARLIACANIYGGVTSVYRWEGKINQSAEVTLIAKTTKKNVGKTITAIKKTHPYALPCVVAYPIANGLPEFLKWVENETE